MNNKHSVEWWKERLPLINIFIEDGKIDFIGSLGRRVILELPSFSNDISRYEKSINTINGIEVPFPIKEPPKYNTMVYVSDPGNINFYNVQESDDIQDFKDTLFERGLVHYSRENAILTAKAMLGIK